MRNPVLPGEQGPDRRLRAGLLAVTMAAALIAGFSPLSASAETRKERAAYDRVFKRCMAEVQPPGSYARSKQETGPNGLPLIVRGTGGTIRGEALLGACVEARMRPGTRVFSAARATTDIKPAKGRNLGGLPLPLQYPLLPGDPELWNGLTRAQQERALQFLANGSTITSSLKGDE